MIFIGASRLTHSRCVSLLAPLIALLFTLLLFTLPSLAAVRIGVFDVSFYKPELVIAPYLTETLTITPHNLYSPHGVAVSSLLVNPHYGGNPDIQIDLMNTGIYLEDFKRGIELARKKGIKLINVSMAIREEAIAQLINQAYEEHGMIFIFSAGNNGARFGRELADYYHSLKAIIVSCIQEDLTLPDFAQIDHSVDILAYCSRNNILTEVVDLRLGPQERLFGQTSAAAPQVTRVIAEYMQNHGELSLERVRQFLREDSPESFRYKGHTFPVLEKSP